LSEGDHGLRQEVSSHLLNRGTTILLVRAPLNVLLTYKKSFPMLILCHKVIY